MRRSNYSTNFTTPGNQRGGEETTIAALIAAGGLAGVDEATLAVLSEAGTFAVSVYISFCVTCLASVAIDELRQRYALNELDDYVVAALDSQGVELGTAVA